METLIYDKQGRAYRLVSRSDEPIPVRLNIRGRKWWLGKEECVGYVNLVQEDADTLMLCDLKIEEAFRDRGLAKEALRYVIALARKQGLRRIVGNIRRGDVDVTPHLPDWYRKQGFTVVDVAPDDTINQKEAFHSSDESEARKLLRRGSTPGYDPRVVYRLVMYLSSKKSNVRA